MVLARPPASLPKSTADLHDKMDKLIVGIAETNKAVLKAVSNPPQVTVNVPQPPVPATTRKSQKRPTAVEHTAFQMLLALAKHTQSVQAPQLAEELFPGEENAYKRSRLIKAATVPAGTANSAMLTRTESAEFFYGQVELSVFAQFTAYGVALTFGGANAITVPQRADTGIGKLNASWVIEGGSIPVEQDVYGSRTFYRFKKAVITVFSRELERVSKVNLFNLLVRHIQEDVARGLDNDAFDPSIAAIPNIRPASLTYGAANSASAGADVAGVVTDLKTLRNKLNGAVRPVLVMHSDRKTALEMLVNDQGVFIFREEVGGKGTIFNLPILHSPYVPSDKVFGLDGAQFMYAADPLEVDASSAATVVMANDDGTPPSMMNPGNITEAGSIHVSDAAGTTPPTEVRSMLQANSTALRAVLPITWGMVQNRAYYLTGVAW